MVQMSCALDMILLWVSAIISLGLMVESLVLGVSWNLQNDPLTNILTVSLILATILDIYPVYMLYF